ncbi:hypothetical protein TPHV1_30131 [Treponema phagedenis]|uniref:Uncharacterized protein n=1 Tax=Treponema phagedenis TaxID=162 RepID=A0A0B7GZX1_TREPH|nr:hypothetical protein [Treponema phagedenis]CEM62236.1 hypothetical protein TPHV1_30131 [Treponema phagedenis]
MRRKLTVEQSLAKAVGAAHETILEEQKKQMTNLTGSPMSGTKKKLKK